MILKTTTDGTSRVAEIQCSVDEMKELMKGDGFNRIFKTVELTDEEQKVVQTALDQQKQANLKWLLEFSKMETGRDVKESEMTPFGNTFIPE